MNPKIFVFFVVLIHRNEASKNCEGKCTVDEKCDTLDGRCVNMRPCTTKKCESGYQCVEIKVNCFRPPCPPVARCRNATDVCEGKCTVDEECDTLGGRCVNMRPCTITDCRNGFKCVERKVDCVRAPCPPVVECVKVTKDCEGKCTVDEECDTLDGRCVNMRPCATKHCDDGSRCVEKKVTCVRAPCPPIAECKRPVPLETSV